MRVVRCLQCSMLLVVVLFLCSFAQAAVVTLDLDSKTAVSDSELLVGRGVQVKGQQVGMLVQSTTETTQSCELIVKGLSEQEYDIYLDGVYKGSKPVEALREGLELNISGRLCEQKHLTCLKAARPGIDAERDRLQAMEKRSVEEARALSNLWKAADFVRSGISLDERMRSVSVVIAPKGSILQRMRFPTKLPTKEAVEGVANACRLLQYARDLMFDGLTDPQLRNSVVSAMTPVSLVVDCDAAGDTAQVTGKLVNDTNLPISSVIALELPQGWKADTEELHLETEPASSSTFTISLVRKPGDAVLPGKINAVADVTITGMFDKKELVASFPTANDTQIHSE